MRKIETENTKTVTDKQAMQVYESDKKQFEDLTSGKTKTMDFAALKRLVLSEMSLNKSIRPQRILGFTRQQIINMCQYPERYGEQILRLMDYIYQKSGYMRRIIDYFSNMPKLNYYIDTEVTDASFMKVNENTLMKNYIKFAAQSSKFNLSNNIHDIVKQMYLHDACFAFVVETDLDISYFYLEPKYCQITKNVNGNIYEFAINRSLLTSNYYATLPLELQQLLEQSLEISPNNLVDIPYKNGFCLKYNNNFLHLFSPLFPMVSDILLVDEYKDLAKTKAVNDAYKLLVLKVPTKDGEITMGDEILQPFVSTALQVVQENIGVLPYPGDVDSVEFSASNSDDRDKVADATTQMYKETGVSEALMSGASSGSELKTSIVNDSGDIFRIYRMLENWISLQMKLRNFIYPSYQFVYRIMDITIFNQTEVIDEELKLAQASMPNKARLCASAGFSPTAMLGNTIIENKIFKDILDMWQPLKSSYTSNSNELSNAVLASFLPVTTSYKALTNPVSPPPCPPETSGSALNGIVSVGLSYTFKIKHCFSSLKSNSPILPWNL